MNKKRISLILAVALTVTSVSGIGVSYANASDDNVAFEEGSDSSDGTEDASSDDGSSKDEDSSESVKSSDEGEASSQGNSGEDNSGSVYSSIDSYTQSELPSADDLADMIAAAALGEEYTVANESVSEEGTEWTDENGTTETQPAENQSAEAQTTEAQTAEAQTTETQPTDEQSAGTQVAEAQASEAGLGENQTSADTSASSESAGKTSDTASAGKAAVSTDFTEGDGQDSKAGSVAGDQSDVSSNDTASSKSDSSNGSTDSNVETGADKTSDDGLIIASADGTGTDTAKADDTEASAVIKDEKLALAVESGAFSLNSSDDSDKVILKPDTEKEDASSDTDNLGTDETDTVQAGGEDSDGLGAEGSASSNKTNQVTVEVASAEGKSNNTEAGSYTTASKTNENGISVTVSGLTEGNADGTLQTILDYYDQLDENSVKLTNDYYVDAEKYSKDKEDAGYDSLLCWAGAASDMLWLSGWSSYIMPAAETVDEVMDYYTEHFTDDEGEPYPAIKYLFDGDKDYKFAGDKNKSQVVEGYENGNKNENTSNISVSDIASDFISMANNLSTLSLLENIADISVGTFLRWMDSSGTVSSSAHWLTAVGLIVDSTKELSDVTRYKGIVLADSDNDGSRDADSTPVLDEKFSRTDALTDKTAKTNSYTVYSLSTATDKYGNSYWTVNNYLANTAKKAVIAGLEYIYNIVYNDDDKPDTSGKSVPEGDQESDDGYDYDYDYDYDDDTDHDQSDKDKKTEGSSDSDKSSDDSKSGESLIDYLRQLFGNDDLTDFTESGDDDLAPSLQSDENQTDTLDEIDGASSAQMSQADVDEALHAALIDRAVDSLSLSPSEIYYVEKTEYAVGSDESFDVYVKGNPQLISGVYIDGVKIPSAYVKLISRKGNVVEVSLLKALLDKLGKGSHIISITYENVVQPVEISFNVK